MVVWLLLVLPVVAIGARIGGARGFTSLAMIQDASPLLMLLAWPAAVLAIVRAMGWATAVAVAACAYSLVILWHGRRRPQTPEWVAGAPTIRLGLGNVYIDNEQPEASARQLVTSGADVLVVVETTSEFRAIFDRVGGLTAYPHRVFDPDQSPDYGVTMYAAAEPRSLSMIDLGRLPAAIGEVEVGSRVLTVVGVIPMAAVDRGGYRTWRGQMRDLGRWVRRRNEPVAVVGDLNTTVHRPGFRDLERAGLRDAHETLGLGLRPSFRVAARGPMAQVGVARLDHALGSAQTWPVAVEDLEAEGSDHRPFVVTLAVRPSAAATRGWFRGRRKR